MIEDGVDFVFLFFFVGGLDDRDLTCNGASLEDTFRLRGRKDLADIVEADNVG